MSLERQYFSLQQVVQSIRKTIDERYQRTYWVKAEMHKLNLYPSGHAFPELVEKVDDKIVAQINGTIWNHNLQRINTQFLSVVREPLKEGTLLLLHVKIVYHELYGISLQILDIDPQFSLGALQKERDETLKRLHSEQLINANQQLPFPILPKRIALISAHTSKGMSDFMQVLTSNTWDYSFFTHLFSAYLQGDGAVPSILAQFDAIEKVKHHFDAVVIVRGGGGEVGLSCYNKYELCKRIATFPLPVLTGIGHSTNMTVAELVAFRNAITPTELADFFIQCFHDASVPLQHAERLLIPYSKGLLEKTNVHFQSEVKHFKNAALIYLGAKHQEVIVTRQSVKQIASQLITTEQHRIGMHVAVHSRLSKQLLREHREKLVSQSAQLVSSKRTLVELQHNFINQFSTTVRLLNPRNVLQRGYAIATYNGKTVDQHNAPEPGSQIYIETYDALLETTLTKITSHEEN